MGKLNELVEEARVAFARLSQREQLMVAGTGVATVLLACTITFFSLSSAVDRAEGRVRSKSQSLAKVMQMQGEYRAKKRAQEQRLRGLRGNVRLTKVVEDAAKSAGFQIGRLERDEGSPSSDGIVQSKVEVQASKLSIDRVQKFLSLIESAPGVVVVQRMKINKPYRKETLDIEVEVTTYQSKG